EPMPQLTLIDGGLGQLDYALKALKDLNLNNLSVIALAEREELVYYDLKQEPLKLGRDNSVLQLLQRVRDEAHRFAITTHRAARNKRFKSKERKS
nr:excinuclease ABC subunit UvrC [Synergistaceae bacterium]